MTDSVTDYVLCNDDPTLQAALSALNCSSEVILDCEGEDLGRAGGSLSLISLRTTASPTSPASTYLIDVRALPLPALRPLFALLASPAPRKIVFDGRMDFAELHHTHAVPLRGVLDLQLADVASRAVRGEDGDDQLRRLSPYMHRREVVGQPGSYARVQKLCSLDQCLGEHLPAGARRGSVSVTHACWLDRPLPEAYLRYAAQDVHRIGRLYEHLHSEGLIPARLPAQSARYVALWADAKPARGDIFRAHALLPLGILDDLGGGGPGATRVCAGCARALAAGAYSKAAWRGVSRMQCWVCRAVGLRARMHRDWEERDGDGDGDVYEGGTDSDDGFGGCDSDDGYGYDSDF